jgi:hypothetical protein
VIVLTLASGDLELGLCIGMVKCSHDALLTSASQEDQMISRNRFGRVRMGVVMAAVAMIGFGLTVAPRSAHAVSPGVAAGIGVGAFALGAALANPYYNSYYAPYGYGYYYPSAPAYLPGNPYYSPAHTCWDPYRNYSYAC